MFKCESCGENVGPKVAPIVRVVETRPQTYTNFGFNEDEEPITIHSKGSEIVREMKVCGICAGLMEQLPT